VLTHQKYVTLERKAKILINLRNSVDRNRLSKVEKAIVPSFSLMRIVKVYGKKSAHVFAYVCRRNIRVLSDTKI